MIEPQLITPQVESTEEPAADLEVQANLAEISVEMAEPVEFALEEVAVVKGLCDRLGVDTLLELIDLLSQ